MCLPCRSTEASRVRSPRFTSDTIFLYALSPDGKRLALSRGTVSTDVVLMTHLPGF